MLVYIQVYNQPIITTGITMTARLIAALTTAAAVAMPMSLGAQEAFENQIKARKGLMDVMALNLGVLGGMARGIVEYDAATAQAAADNLVAVSSVNHLFFWPEGSDNMSVDNTRALPAIWENLDGVVASWTEFGAKSEALAAVAGDGQAALGPAVGGVGGVCQACHEDFREPNN